MSRGRRYISSYQVHKVYGGAEEGGWYYTVYELVDTIKCTNTNKAKKLYKTLWGDFSSDLVYFLERKRDIGAKDTTNDPRPHYC